MSTEEVDNYLTSLDEPGRSTLAELRRTILGVVPDAEQGMSYGMPVFRVRGQAIAGFGAFARHLSYFPHSGSMLSRLADDVAPYRTSKGALQFPVDNPLPAALVERLVAARLDELTEPPP